MTVSVFAGAVESSGACDGGGTNPRGWPRSGARAPAAPPCPSSDDDDDGVVDDGVVDDGGGRGGGAARCGGREVAGWVEVAGVGRMLLPAGRAPWGAWCGCIPLGRCMCGARGCDDGSSGTCDCMVGVAFGASAKNW